MSVAGELSLNESVTVSLQSNPPKEVIMSSTASQIFSQLAALIGEDIFMNVVPVISSASAAVNSNPQAILNPLNAGIFGVKLLADLQGALPQTEAVAVQDVAQVANAILTTLSARVAAVAASSTPTAIAAEIVGSAPAATPAVPAASAPAAGSIAAS